MDRAYAEQAERLDNEVPTRVGMDRRRQPRRGDDPARSPRAWGWTAAAARADAGQARGPHARGDGPVGVDGDHGRLARGPHARGDGPPECSGCTTRQLARSPRAWGWTVAGRAMTPLVEVPTRVGMDRPRGARHSRQVRGPHARGDGPRPGSRPRYREVPTRVGMDRRNASASRGARIEVPTRVGMDRTTTLGAAFEREVPTRVGMDRLDWAHLPRQRQRSPRAWGWTVAASIRSARARGPHARGDGPSVLPMPPGERCEVPTRVGMDRPSRVV